MADHKECKHYEDCDYRNGVGSCPDSCVQYKNKDVVKVVRCKDCRHQTVRFGRRFCEVWTNYNGMGDDGYCNYGERKGDERKDI